MITLGAEGILRYEKTMNDEPRFHLGTPDYLGDVLMANRLGRELAAAGLGRGDRFTYSQALTEYDIGEAAGWAGLHVMPDGPCAMIVVRPTPRLPVGSWAVNLNHIGSDWPTLGRIVSQVPCNWVKLRPYTIQGERMKVVEPLDARWLARICTPAFPLDGVIFTRTGAGRRIGGMGLVPWSRIDDVRMRYLGARGIGLEAGDLDESKTVAALVAGDPLLCRALGYQSERLLADVGLLPRQDAESSIPAAVDYGRSY